MKEQNAITHIICLIQNAISPRKIDGRYSPAKVQPIVDKALEGKPFDECKALLIEADVQEAEHLVNAIARILVGKNKPLVLAIVQGQAGGIPDHLHIYLKKHLKLCQRGSRYQELSVADLVEEFDRFRFSEYLIISPDSSSLSIRDELTSLYGLHMLEGHISYSKVEYLSIVDSCSHWGALSIDEDPDFPHGPFSKFYQLKHLRINDQSIIDSFFFLGLKNLESLNMGYLTHIKHDSFCMLAQLKSLNLSNFMGDRLDENVFNSFTSLEHLGLSGNSLPTLRILPNNIFKSLSQLKSLFIHDFRFLSGLPVDIFSSLSNLERLFLCGNSLSEFTVDYLSHLTKLKLLDLRGNKIDQKRGVKIKKYGKRIQCDVWVWMDYDNE